MSAQEDHLRNNDGLPLSSLRHEEVLCDFTIIGPDGQRVRAHKLLLAASCTYFRSLFTGPWAAQTKDELQVDLQHVTGHVLQHFVEVLYIPSGLKISDLFPKSNDSIMTNTFRLDSVRGMLQLISYFGAESLLHRCQQPLAEMEADSAFWLQLLPMCSDLDLQPFLDYLTEIAATNLSSMMLYPKNVAPIITALSCPRLKALLDKAGTAANEQDQLDAVVMWLGGAPQARLKDAYQLLCRLHLHTRDLIRMVESAADCCRDTEVSQALKTAEKELRKSVDDAAMQCSMSGHKLQSGLLVCGGRGEFWTGITETEVYNPVIDAWKPGVNLPSHLVFAGGAESLQRPVVVGCDVLRPHVYVYDPGTRQWNQHGDLITPRRHAAVAGCNNTVYVHAGSALQGGTTKKMTHGTGQLEFLSPGSKTWEPAAESSVIRLSHGLASLQGKLYAVGGQNIQVFDSTECYDPEIDSWSTLAATMACRRKYISLTAHEGRLFAVGGVDKGRRRLDMVEALDVREGKWQRLPNMLQPRSSSGVSSLDGSLYVVAGLNTTSADPEIPLATVEAYVSTAGKWLARAPLKQIRTGHTVLPVCHCTCV